MPLAIGIPYFGARCSGQWPGPQKQCWLLLSFAKSPQELSYSTSNPDRQQIQSLSVLIHEKQPSEPLPYSHFTGLWFSVPYLKIHHCRCWYRGRVGLCILFSLPWHTAESQPRMYFESHVFLIGPTAEEQMISRARIRGRKKTRQCSVAKPCEVSLHFKLCMARCLWHSKRRAQGSTNSILFLHLL